FESFIYSGLIVTIIKSVFGRWRPFAEHGNFSFVFFTPGPNDHLSLPSGDVAIAFAFSSVMAALFENKLWKIFWYMLALLAALGRIYHDQHWLSDTMLAAAITIWVGNFVNNRKFCR
ncbi:MAG: phosphatase PAP2 family protein, partial [Methanococcaceae archaeon]